MTIRIRKATTTTSTRMQTFRLLAVPTMMMLPFLLLLLEDVQAFQLAVMPTFHRMHYSQEEAHLARRRQALMTVPRQSTGAKTKATCLNLSSSSSSLPDVKSMKLGDMRKELESYGISTKTFLEKSDFVKALQTARAEGKTATTTTTATTTNDDKNNNEKTKSTNTNRVDGKVNGAAPDANNATSDDSNDKPNGSSSSLSRDERLRQEMDKARTMKVKDLRDALAERGISTQSFIEKSEFVKAYAEAVVDNINKKKKTGSTTSSNGNNKGNSNEEPYDPDYRDVVMQKMSNRDPRLLSGTIIDIQLAR